ncbi:MAG: metalloregulator ArsR/SmtB family transcription factor [Micrococcales bacterium]|nr:metalloregulator ArsR/SmtB family transcription factor [Micrococcales bacterium]
MPQAHPHEASPAPASPPAAAPDLRPSGPDARRWATRFDLLADPTRLRLLRHMHLCPGCAVGDLAAAADITPTAASQALRVLRDQGWVQASRDGRAMRYSLIDETAHRLLHFIGDQHRP